MRVSRPVLSSLSGAAFAVGGLWAVAGVLHAIFGVAITFPLLPPLDLERISEPSAFAHALAFFAAGAGLGRWGRAAGASPAKAVAPALGSAAPAAAELGPAAPLPPVVARAEPVRAGRGRPPGAPAA